ncbi:polyprenyl diphosphate synthase [Hydrocarboniphaga sp.]|uniref:polyprenyl diphosphate synthase n=1 Tax=Hydrocarboniphaga sp. TaxID=2033016 RepID=UPI003D12BD45
MTQLPPKIPAEKIPVHVAVIMDGNGRWAKQRMQPRAFGHRAGVKSARKILRAAHKAGVRYLTVFAFSQENWKRPELEVTLLMKLFINTLMREAQALHKNGVRLRFIGDHGDFSPELREQMDQSVKLTRHNTGLQLQVAVGYGGQWDVVQAAKRAIAAGQEITAETIESHLDTAGVPAPDLLIRTGGEMRISNFLLWQLAYTELYFCDTLWPEFGDAEFAAALRWYSERDRRFGRVAEQV